MFFDIWSDVRYALRKLGANPGFTLMVVFILALGIAVNTTMFSVINALLLQPIPARHPEQLVAVFSSVSQQAPFRSSSYLDYLDIRERTSDVVSDLAAYTLATADLKLGPRTQHISAGMVTANYFHLLEVEPLMGRAFLAEESQLSNPRPVALVSSSLWRNRFGADPNIVGKPVHLNDQIFTVVGVLDDKYCRVRHFFQVDLFLPATTEDLLSSQHNLASRQATQFFLLGRLLPGVSMSQAQAKLNLIASELHQQFPEFWSNERGLPGTITVLSERNSRVPPQAHAGVIAFSVFLLTMVGMVLFIACANLASLFLARALSREKEIAVRIAVGSTRFRLVRQLLTESFLLSIAGTVAALVLTYWASSLLAGYRPPTEVSLGLDLKIDFRVLLFALFTMLLTTIFFGLAPALHATRPDLVSALKDTVSLGRKHRFALRNLLIVGEVAISLVLLMPAGLFWRSLQRFDALDIGFDRDHLALVAVTLSPDRYSPERGELAMNEILRRVRAVPGVQHADFALTVPLSGMLNTEQYEELGAREKAHGVDTNVVGTDYFQTMRIPFSQGRGFDQTSSDEVAVVNQEFADLYWPHQNPLGKLLVNPDKPGKAIQVIGVVATGKYHSISESPVPMVYRPISQEYVPTVFLHVRTAVAPEMTLNAITREVQNFDPTLPVFDVKTMREELAVSVAPYEAITTLLGIFGGFAVVLAFAGLYSLIAYQAQRRTREIGIRIALGALPWNILVMIARQGMTLVVVGICVGIPMAIGITLLVSSFLFGVSPLDPATYLGVSVLMGAIAFIAVVIPARRAIRIQPTEALRAS